MHAFQSLLIIVYQVLPALALAWPVYRCVRLRSYRPLIPLAVVVVTALGLAIAVHVYYARISSSLIEPWEVLVSAYLALGVLTLFRIVGWGLKQGADLLFAIRTPGRARELGANWWMARAVGASLVRSVALFTLALAYVIAVGIVYRPTLDTPMVDPTSQFGVTYEPVTFEAVDGVRLSGWWIPAPPPPTTDVRRAVTRPATLPDLATEASETSESVPHSSVTDSGSRDVWGKRTVIVCHGYGATKGRHLALVRDLLPNGFNVLAFDFRAHGQSGGAFTSFGDAERFDVLGAVRWLKQSHPRQAEQVLGVGVDTGGAALVAAAASDDPNAAAIDAIAIFGGFEDLASLSDDLTMNLTPAPLEWLTKHVSAPIASAHAGANLASFSPGALADKVAPRPMMVVHGRGDTRVPFSQGVGLFDRASQPKVRLWVGERDAKRQWVVRSNPRVTELPDGEIRPLAPVGPPADHERILHDDDAVRALRLFFEGGRSML